MAADFYMSMTTIMAQFSDMILFGQSINNNWEVTCKSTMLICEEIHTILSNIFANMMLHHNELSKGLNNLGQFILHEVAVAIATTSEKSNSLNKALLQTIVELLQNHSNVQVGDHSTSPATSSQPSPNFGPSASTEAQPAQGKPKPRGIGSLPKIPIVSFVNHDNNETEPEELPPMSDLDMEGDNHLRSELF
jgi:hypothetical protein